MPRRSSHRGSRPSRYAAFAATGVVLSATYMLWMFQRVNYGPLTNEKNAALPDLVPREWVVLVPIVAMTVVMGVVPNLFLRPMEPSVNRMLSHVRQRSGQEFRTGLRTGFGIRDLGFVFYE